MPIVGIQCVEQGIPGAPPQLNVPNFGVLEKANEALDRIPDEFDLILKFQDQMAQAMGPVRRFLEMIETFSALFNCMQAVPKSILQLSPQPIFECLEELAKKIAKLLSYMPPLSYVAMGLDIASFCIDAIDGLMAFFQRLDNKIAGLMNLHASATAGGDLELASSAQCSLKASIPPMIVGLQMLTFAAPMLGALMECFIRLLPGGGALTPLQETLKLATAYCVAASAAMQANPLNPLPGFDGGPPGMGPSDALMPVGGISTLLEVISLQRTVIVEIYNILAPVLGREKKRSSFTIPNFQYL